MVGYRRMGNMDNHLANTTSTTVLLQQLMETLNSPRGTVLLIQALALVAIILPFLLVAFGSCRCWSNHWIVQQGYLAANALCLSLGIYSIGLMQSSVVKSDLYPVWAVSLLALFGCVDPVTSYNGIDYKSPLSKMLFQLSLYLGHVLLMSIPTISSDVGNLAIWVLSAIVFLKGFHRSMAHVLPRRMQHMLEYLHDDDGKYSFAFFSAQQIDSLIGQDHLGLYKNLAQMVVDFPPANELHGFLSLGRNAVSLKDIELSLEGKDELRPLFDLCFAFSLSHTLHKHLLRGVTNGQTYRMGRMDLTTNYRDMIDYNWALSVIEIELAFLYEILFTSNEFLHYHQATMASFWTLASFMGICFVGVAVAVRGPGTMSKYRTTRDPFVTIIFVDSTMADLIITLVILVFLALLQLIQLIRCWTSNWARVAVACEYARKHKRWRMEMEKDDEMKKRKQGDEGEATGGYQKKEFSPTRRWSWWMRFKAFVVTRRSRSNWFDKYLWQKKLGQYSFIPEGSSRRWCKPLSCIKTKKDFCIRWKKRNRNGCDYTKYAELLGIQYVRQVLRDLLGSDNKKGDDLRLDDDVKLCITSFLGRTTGDKTGKDWSLFLVDEGAKLEFLPYTPVNRRCPMPDATHYAWCVIIWHAATCYCELVEQVQDLELTGCSGTAAATSCFQKQKAAGCGGERDRNRRVAVALSKYCAYLLVSAPELLPGPSMVTKYVCSMVEPIVEYALEQDKDKLESLKRYAEKKYEDHGFPELEKSFFWEGLRLGQRLHGRGDPWKVLVEFWLQALIYAAPYGEVEAHMQHLSQGGELITHVWAMLYHIGIREWQPGEPKYRDEEAEDSRDDEGHTEVEEVDISEVKATRKRTRVKRRPYPHPVRTEEENPADGMKTDTEEVNMEDRVHTERVEDINLSLQHPESSSCPVHSINQHIPDLNELPLDNKLHMHDNDLTKDWIKMSL